MQVDIYEVEVKRMDKVRYRALAEGLVSQGRMMVSVKIISKCAQREGVGEFVDDVDGDVWFKVFFGYPGKY